MDIKNTQKSTTDYNYCANCQCLCPAPEGTIQFLDLYNSSTEEYNEVGILDALGIIFKRSSSSSKDPHPVTHEHDLCFCCNCTDLYKELVDAYLKFTMATRAGSYVFYLLSNESENDEDLDCGEAEEIAPEAGQEDQVKFIKIEGNDEDAGNLEPVSLVPECNLDHDLMTTKIQVLSKSSRKKRHRIMKIKREVPVPLVPETDTKLHQDHVKNEPLLGVGAAGAGADDDDKLDLESLPSENESQPQKPKIQRRSGSTSAAPAPAPAGASCSSTYPSVSYPYPVSPIPTTFKCPECSLMAQTSPNAPEPTFPSILLWRIHQQSTHSRCYPRLTKTYDKRRKGCRRISGTQLVEYFPCYICGKGICGGQALKAHIENIHKRFEEGGGPETCSICGKQLKSKATLDAHMKGKHMEDGGEDRKFMCSICGHKFKAKVNLNVHEATHRSELKPEGRFQCHICHEKFQLQCRLKRHLSKHSSERPYKCTHPHCNNSYKDRLHLMNHLRLHRKRDEMAEACEICGKRFSLKTRVKDHLIGVHKVSREDAIVLAKINLRHVVRLSEEGEKEYQEKMKQRLKPSPTCGYCSKKYSRREYLTTHLINVHNVDKDEAFRMTGIDTKRDILASTVSVVSSTSNKHEAIVPDQMSLETGSESLSSGIY